MAFSGGVGSKGQYTHRSIEFSHSHSEHEQQQQHRHQQHQQHQQHSRRREGRFSSDELLIDHATTSAPVYSIDEAYRRLGHKLSQRVTSGEQYPAKVVLDIGCHPTSAFSSLGHGDCTQQEQQQQQQYQYQYDDFDEIPMNPPTYGLSNAMQSSSINGTIARITATSKLMQHHSEMRNRTNKVAKIGYSHLNRSHHPQYHYEPQDQQGILKKLTLQIKSTYRNVESTKQQQLQQQFQQGRHTKTQQPQQQERQSLGTTNSNINNNNHTKKRASPTTISAQGGGLLANLQLDDPSKRGCLETSLDATITRTTNTPTKATTITNTARASTSATTATTVTTTTTTTTTTTASTETAKKCFTIPREPVANDGLDNSEGNLIVYEGDVITVSNLSIVKRHSKTSGADDYDRRTNAGLGSNLRVVDLLGQGTFAQVFLCECLDAVVPTTQTTGSSHRQIALKIVKNKQAYTRQAAIEIDIFRALADSKINMVHLDCFFIYRNHLCLVFELLGLNLYEVLKGRQFRGLPLSIVRSLMKQAIEGIRELSAKSIVHCDLKPENILLEGDAVSLIRAGDVALTLMNTNGRTSNNKATVTTAMTDSTAGANATASQVSKKFNGTPSTDSTGATTNTDSVSGMSDSTGSSRENSCNPPLSGPKIKLIDFGSACFEGRTSHTYIQSRFYRSPEVLVGLPYDSAIDMWSLGCVAAELYLGLPILPGVHEHDQLGRILEMIGPLPDWMLDQGTKSTKYFAKHFARTPQESAKALYATAGTPLSGFEPNDSCSGQGTTQPHAPPPAKPSWRIKTQQEYIQSLSASEIRKKGGLAKLERQPANRYFKRTKLSDIVMLHGKLAPGEGKDQLALFVHFLLGILDPDPWKRWTAFQAAQHPFLSGGRSRVDGRPEVVSTSSDSKTNSTDTTDKASNSSDSNSSNDCDIHWIPPWDPSICRRKLLNVQKTREKQQAIRRGSSGTARRYDGGDRVEKESYDRPRRGSGSAFSMDGGATGSLANNDMAGRQTSMTNDRISPPSPPGRSQSGVSGLHSALGSSGLHSALLLGSGSYDVGRVSSQGYTSGPQQGIPEYSQYSFSASVSSMAMSHGDMSIPQVPLHLGNGPQSYSDFSYEGVNMQRVEAEFGFALQRPGVVPSIHDLGGSYSSVGQQSSSNVAFSPHHHPVSSMAQLQMAYGVRHTSLPSMSQRRGARHGYNKGHPTMSQTTFNLGLHHAPTMIREDCSDHLSVGGETSSIGSGASLLAQQLEAQAAMARDSRAGPKNPKSTSMDSSLYQLQNDPHASGYNVMSQHQQSSMYSEYNNGGPPPSNSAFYSAYAPDHHLYVSNPMYASSNAAGYHPGSDHRVSIPMTMQQHHYAMEQPPSLQPQHFGNSGFSHHVPPNHGRNQHQHPQQHQHQQYQQQQQHPHQLNYPQHYQQTTYDEMERTRQAGFNFPYVNRGLSM